MHSFIVPDSLVFELAGGGGGQNDSPLLNPYYTKVFGTHTLYEEGGGVEPTPP